MNFENLFFGKILDLLSINKAITIPTDFHTQCDVIRNMLENDVTGVINTILNYAIDSASEANYTIECGNDNLEGILNNWLENINIEYQGKIPCGIKELAREYYKERWQGSSLCLMRVQNWKEYPYGNSKIVLPRTLVFVNGSSVYIPNADKKLVQHGEYKYYLDANKEYPLPKLKTEKIIVQKPFSRWYSAYPTPYLIQNGVYKNFKAIEILQDKGDEVVTKLLPYIFIIKKGLAEWSKNVNAPTEDDLKTLNNNIDTMIEDYKSNKGKTPTATVPGDTEFNHLIPDFAKIISENLFAQSTRNILSGLGFVDVIQGVSSTRKESVLNPKPFIASVNSGVTDFKKIIFNLVQLVAEENKIEHNKFFSEKNKLMIVSSPLKINTEQILDELRQSFIYGATSYKTYHEVLGLDHDTEKKRARQEYHNDEREIFYPHLIQNVESHADTNLSPAPITKKEIEKTNEKLEAKELVECENCKAKIDYLSIPEKGMGYIECPNCGISIDQTGKCYAVKNEDLETAPFKDTEDLINKHPNLKKYPVEVQKIFLEVFNSILSETGDEARAFSGAYSKMNKYLQRHYVKKDGIYVKKGEDK